MNWTTEQTLRLSIDTLERHVHSLQRELAFRQHEQEKRTQIRQVIQLKGAGSIEDRILQITEVMYTSEGLVVWVR